MPIVGEVFTSLGLMVCTYFFYEFNMEVAVFVESVPLAITGGWNVMFLGVYTYICSIATDDTRTLRIGMVHVVFSISFMVRFSPTVYATLLPPLPWVAAFGRLPAPLERQAWISTSIPDAY